MISKETATQQYVIQMAAAPSSMHADRYAAKVLSVILGDDTGSRLYWKLVDPGHAEHASIHYSAYHDAGAYLAYLSCDPDFVDQNLKASSTSIGRPKRQASPKPSCCKPRPKSNRARCWAANGRAAASSSSAAIGPTVASTARSETI